MPVEPPPNEDLEEGLGCCRFSLGVLSRSVKQLVWVFHAEELFVRDHPFWRNVLLIVERERWTPPLGLLLQEAGSVGVGRERFGSIAKAIGKNVAHESPTSAMGSTDTDARIIGVSPPSDGSEIMLLGGV